MLLGSGVGGVFDASALNFERFWHSRFRVGCGRFLLVALLDPNTVLDAA